MGCFNIMGFHSKTPIVCGNKIGAIVCINLCNGMNGHGSTAAGIIPIMSPIYGKYNDYGSIEDYKQTEGYKMFEQITRHSFEEFLNLHERHAEVCFGEEIPVRNENDAYWDNKDVYLDIIKKLRPMIPNDIENVLTYLDKIYDKACISIIYEHEAVLKALEEYGSQNHYESLNKLAEYNCIENPWLVAARGTSDILTGDIQKNLIRWNDAMLLVRALRLNEMSIEYPELVVYKKVERYNNLEAVKSEILSLIDISIALTSIGSCYSMSLNCGQFYDKVLLSKLNEINKDIIDKLHFVE